MGETRIGYQSYDYRLRELAYYTGNPSLFDEHNIPRTTLNSWMQSEPNAVITDNRFDLNSFQLQAQLIEQDRRVNDLEAEMSLIKAVIENFDISIDYQRLSDGEKKATLLELIDRASSRIGLQKCLDSIGLSSARYHDWKRRAKGCDLSDYSSCPKSKPSQLTPKELEAMESMVKDKELRHFPIRALAWHAIRIGKVIASASTWGRMIKAYGWARPRKREHPSSPKVGIQADKPNEIWHVDVSVLRLVNGKKVFIQAVIDNFSRYVLIWKVSKTISGLNTKELLREALHKSLGPNVANPPNLLCDSGVENINEEVDKLIDEGLIVRTIAQIQIDFSNSMIEALFRSLKHNRLFLFALDSFMKVERQADIYFNDHNLFMPHSALRGATPEEVYHGHWDKLVQETIPKEIKKAIEERLKYHQQLQQCKICIEN